MKLLNGNLTASSRILVLRTALTIHPTGMALDIVFFFPYRQPDFDLVNNITAGGERLIPMC